MCAVEVLRAKTDSQIETFIPHRVLAMEVESFFSLNTFVILQKNSGVIFFTVMRALEVVN